MAPLPAPYENPWGLLARDLRAVVASLGLQVRQLWRRNRQGDLSLPRFWPTDLAPLFWPLALALALGMLTLLGLGAGNVIFHGISGINPPRQLSEMPLVLADGSELDRAGGDGAGEDVADAFAPIDLGEPPLPATASPPAPASPPADPAEAESKSGAAVQPLTPESDPLPEAMDQVDPGHWITALEPDPERGTLTLVLAAPFTALPEAKQLQQAEIWQNQAMVLGFDRLELADRHGRPIGRQARVGSGMILLTPQHLS